MFQDSTAKFPARKLSFYQSGLAGWLAGWQAAPVIIDGLEIVAVILMILMVPNVKIRITRDVKLNINGMLLVTELVVANLISLINCLALI